MSIESPIGRIFSDHLSLISRSLSGHNRVLMSKHARPHSAVLRLTLMQGRAIYRLAAPIKDRVSAVREY